MPAADGAETEVRAHARVVFGVGIAIFADHQLGQLHIVATRQEFVALIGKAIGEDRINVAAVATRIVVGQMGVEGFERLDELRNLILLAFEVADGFDEKMGQHKAEPGEG